MITDNLKNALILLYVAIFLLFGITKFIQKVFKKDIENMCIRLKSFLGITLFFTVAFLFNKITAFCFIGLISYLCLKEFFSIIPVRRTDRNIYLWAYLSIPVSLYIVYIKWINLFYIFIPLYMFIWISTRMVLSGNTKGFLKNLAVMQYGLMSTVYALCYLGLIYVIPNENNPKAGALGLLYYILVLTVANDFIQMFTGKILGKHKIIPSISPNKTWEGFIGGVIGTTILSVLMGNYVTDLSIGQLTFLGIILAAFGFFGDVTVSAIKRDFGIKDTSTLIPGHGGILDRLDSLLFTAPLFFHFYAYTHTLIFTRGI